MNKDKGEELKAWRKMVGLSQQQAADVHGYSRRQWQKMERGFEEIRNCVWLGCAAYALGIRSYDGPSIAAQMEKDGYRKGNHRV